MDEVILMYFGLEVKPNEPKTGFVARKLRSLGSHFSKEVDARRLLVDSVGKNPELRLSDLRDAAQLYGKLAEGRRKGNEVFDMQDNQVKAYRQIGELLAGEGRFGEAASAFRLEASVVGIQFQILLEERFILRAAGSSLLQVKAFARERDAHLQAGDLVNAAVAVGSEALAHRSSADILEKEGHNRLSIARREMEANAWDGQAQVLERAGFLDEAVVARQFSKKASGDAAGLREKMENDRKEIEANSLRFAVQRASLGVE